MPNQFPSDLPAGESINDYIAFLRDQREVAYVDFSSNGGRARLEKRLKKIVDTHISDLDGHSREIARMMIDGEKRFIKKRVDSILKIMPEAGIRFEGKYPDLSAEMEFVCACGVCSYSTYDSIDSTDFTTLAAAIWILDELDQRGDLKEIFPILPDGDEIKGVELPEYFEDACFDESIIRGMIYIIRNRNDDSDATFDNYRKTYINNAALKRSEKRWNYNADNSGNIPVSNRGKFDFIMSLLNSHVVERAVKRFEEKQWEVFDRYLKCADRYRQEEIAIIDEIIGLLERQIELIPIIRKKLEERALNTFSNAGNTLLLNPPSPNYLKRISAGDYSALFGKLSYGQLPEQIEFERITKTVNEKDRARIQCYSMHTQVSLFVGNDHNPEHRPEAFADVVYPDVKPLFELEVDNPYETCFALLFLLDSGSPMPWLVPLGVSVMLAAAKKLPWNCFPNYQTEDVEYDEDEEEGIQEGSEEEAAEPDEAGNPVDESEEGEEEIDPIDWIEEEANLYKQKYYYPRFVEKTGEYEADKDFPLNFPQFIYSQTNVAVPRNVHNNHGMAEIYQIAGFSEIEAELLEKFVTLADFEFYKRINREHRERFHETLSDSPEDENGQVEPDNPEDVDELKRNIESLKEEIKRAHDERRRLERESESQKAENEELKKELAELRSMIRSSKSNATDGNAEKDPEISFPYAAKGRYVVFGGHDSWSRAIKPLLDNVRFIVAGAKPNVSLILNADTVWIQSNAIGHSDYYKILDVIRTHGIKMEYFAYASAEKCAEQLALYDLRNNGEYTT